MRSRLFVIPLGLALLLSISACAVLAEPTASETPIVTESPSPEPEPEPVSERPEPQVPVTCDDIPIAEEFEALDGRRMAAQIDTSYPIYWAALEQSGELRCGWRFGELSAPERVSASFMIQRHAPLRFSSGDPSPIELEAQDGPAVSCPPAAYGAFQCTAAAVVDDYLVTSLIWGSTGPASDAAMTAMVTDVQDGLVAQLEERPVPELWTPPATASPLVFDCVAKFGDVGIGAIMGDPAMSVRDTSGIGEDYLQPRDIASLGGLTTCDWRAEPEVGRSIRADVLSGGAWYRTAFDPTGDRTSTPLDLPGADSAALLCDTQCSVEATVGVDAVRVSGGLMYAPWEGTEEQLIAAATDIVAAFADR